MLFLGLQGSNKVSRATFSVKWVDLGQCDRYCEDLGSWQGLEGVFRPHVKGSNRLFRWFYEQIVAIALISIQTLSDSDDVGVREVTTGCSQLYPKIELIGGFTRETMHLGGFVYESPDDR